MGDDTVAVRGREFSHLNNRIDPRRALPDYLPARMINEHVYCPRLFYFEQVEGVFVDNEHTVRGLGPAQAGRQGGQVRPQAG